MKKILILLLIFMSSTAFGLMPEKGVSPTTVGQIKNAENSILEKRIDKYKLALHKGRLMAYKRIEIQGRNK